MLGDTRCFADTSSEQKFRILWRLKNEPARVVTSGVSRLTAARDLQSLCELGVPKPHGVIQAVHAFTRDARTLTSCGMAQPFPVATSPHFSTDGYTWLSRLKSP